MGLFSGIVNTVKSAAPIIGTAVGTAFGGPIGGAVGGALGSAISGNSGGGSAGGLISGALGAGGSYLSGQQQLDAANQAANAQIQAARIAADAARFRPIGISTRFGASQFGFSPEGVLTSAGYTVSPELRNIQDFLMSQAGQTGDTSRLLSLGRGYLGASPQEVAQNVLQQQQGLLQPARERQLGQIREQLQRTGRSGLAVGQGGTLGAANPELQAYYNAIAQQDALLAAQAEQEARNRITFGQGLLSSAYSPILTPVGAAGQIESLGQAPLDIGAQLGGRSAQAGTAQANALLQGGLGAARTNLAAQQQVGSPLGQFLTGLAGNKQFTSGVGNWFENLISGGGVGGGIGAGTPFGGFDLGSTSTPGLWSDLSFD